MPRALAPHIPNREMTNDQYDRLVKRWNHIGKANRKARFEQCRKEGHDWRTYDDARVCIRCLQYTFD